MNELSFGSKVTLNNGITMPVLGLGVWKAQDGDEVKQAVSWAIEAGYTLIDTAKIYGNEGGVGEAVREAHVPREDLFITTKLWNADQGYENAHKAIDESLARLHVRYVDLYLVHWPSKDAEERKETWRAMEEILKSGKASAVGVSNYTIEHLQEMQSYSTLVPAVNQIEFHPFWYQEALLHYCKQQGTVVEAYSPLARAERLSEPQIVAIAQKLGKSPAQVLIRWSLQHGCVVIPKSVHRERIIENKEVFDFELTDEDMALLNALNENQSVL